MTGEADPLLISQVYSIADAGYLLWGPIGREVLGSIYWLCKGSVHATITVEC